MPARRTVLPFASPDSVFGGDGAAHRSAQAPVALALSRQAVEPERMVQRATVLVPRRGLLARLG